MRMKKIEAIIQPNRLDSVKKKLESIGVTGMTVSEVKGCGRQKGHKEIYRGAEYYVDLIPKVKIEIYLPNELVEVAKKTIINCSNTGKIGDGKIFVIPVEGIVRIRTGEKNLEAL